MQHVSQERERTVILVMKYMLSFRPCLLASSQSHFGSNWTNYKQIHVASYYYAPSLNTPPPCNFYHFNLLYGERICGIVHVFSSCLGGSQPSDLMRIHMDIYTYHSKRFSFNLNFCFCFCLEFLFQITEGDRHRGKKKKEKQAAEKMTSLGLMRENS